MVSYIKMHSDNNFGTYFCCPCYLVCSAIGLATGIVCFVFGCIVYSFYLVCLCGFVNKQKINNINDFNNINDNIDNNDNNIDIGV